MKLWEKNVRQVTPYVPGEQPRLPDMIKLNTNENPYPPAPGVKKALNAMAGERLRLYPDPSCGSLVTALADYYHVKREQVFVGVGSDDVLSMAFLTFFCGSTPILFPDITYSFYDVWAKVYGIPYVQKPLRKDLTINPEDYKGDNGGIVFPNPNAPTGVFLPLEAVEDIVRSNPGSVVIVDEAYIDFGGMSALPLIEKYDNLLVVQTFSKSRSMAGMRIGYAIGSQELIRHMISVKESVNSYTMNTPSLLAGVAAVEDDAYFRECCHKIVTTRERVKKEMKALGFSFGDSVSNFLFVTHEACSARELFEALRQKHIFVRYFDRPRISNYLRITVGTDEEMDALIDFLKEYLSSRKESS